MSRPPEIEKRRELARRAAVVLQREGLGLKVAQLADALGVKRPTLLYHFPTYGHLVEAALTDLLTEQAAYVMAEVERHTHPIDRLYAQMVAVHAFHHGREERVVFLTQAIAATAGPRLGEIVEAGNQVFEPYRRAMIESLRRGIDEGTVAPCDPEALVSLVRSVIDGLMVQRVTARRPLAPVHELLWHGLLSKLKRPPRRATPAPRPRKPSQRSRS